MENWTGVNLVKQPSQSDPVESSSQNRLISLNVLNLSTVHENPVLSVVN